MEGVLSDPDKDPDLTVATSMSDDTTKPISSTEIYDLSLDSSSICSGVTKENLIFFLQYFAKIYTEKEVKEAKVISMALGVLSSERHDVVRKFINSVVSFFKDCFREVERENNQQQKAIKVEKIFAERRSNSCHYAVVQNAWDNLCCLEKNPEGINNEFSNVSETILQQILQHFWSVKSNKAELNVKFNDQQCTGMESFSTSCTDSSEYESIKDHAGWALKRTRDVLVKGPNQIPLKETDEPTSTILYADKPSAIEIISLLGTDVKQLDSNFRFIIHDHVTPFFVYLHVLVEEMLKPLNFETQRGNVLLQCLSELSKNKELREKWLALVSNSDLKTAIVVLQRVVTFFVKSKQQIVREKEGLKPNKNSISLRQGIKSSIKKNTSRQTRASTEILTLREAFGCSKTVADFLSNLEKLPQTDRKALLSELHGKELTKILKAIGQPGLKGKRKENQITLLLQAIEKGVSSIRSPEEVCTQNIKI